MRTASLTTEEILRAEKVADDRKNHRNSGFELMKDRDQGAARLSNGVLMEWPVKMPAVPDNVGFYLYPKSIEEGTVILDGKLYDKEELLKWLRWA